MTNRDLIFFKKNVIFEDDDEPMALADKRNTEKHVFERATPTTRVVDAESKRFQDAKQKEAIRSKKKRETCT
mgnify:FL=1